MTMTKKKETEEEPKKEKEISHEIDEALEEGDSKPEETKKKSSPSPIVLAVAGLVAFAVFLGVFSFTMGVFDKKPVEKQAEEPSAQQAPSEAEPEEYADLTNGYERYGEEQIDFNFGGDEADTLDEITWIEAEKQKIAAEQLKLAVERKQLETLKREVEALLSRKKVIANERIAYMAKLFDGMKQDQIGKLMAELDDATIVAVLPKMKPASASKVLAMLPPERAARITTILLGLGKS